MPLFLGLLLACLPMLSNAAQDLDWAYPSPTTDIPLSDGTAMEQVPGSTRRYAQEQIDNPFEPPDWFPTEHPPMPAIVAQGRKPGVLACALCHLPTGAGHPESASLAGQPLSYLVRQIAEFKNGGRTHTYAPAMARIAQGLSDEEVTAASRYFASLRPHRWTKVVETDQVPASYVGTTLMRFAIPGGQKEPIGNRIIVLPQEEARAKARDPHSGFIDFVPIGSIARGRSLVRTGGAGKTLACATCHGPALQGQGDAPAIVGRPPIYIVRQLNDIKANRRTGAAIAPMTAVVAGLTTPDMIAIAAYLGSYPP